MSKIVILSYPKEATLDTEWIDAAMMWLRRFNVRQTRVVIRTVQVCGEGPAVYPQVTREWYFEKDSYSRWDVEKKLRTSKGRAVEIRLTKD
jgi:hypothetical protein